MPIDRQTSPRRLERAPITTWISVDSSSGRGLIRAWCTERSVARAMKRAHALRRHLPSLSTASSELLASRLVGPH